MEFTFVCENPLFFNWTGSVFALRDTKCSLHKYVEEKTQQYLNDWPPGLQNHIPNFVKHNIGIFESAIKLYNLKCHCPECEGVYKRLLELKTSPGEPLQLQRVWNKYDKLWIVLSMYVSKGGERIRSLEECDVAAFCSLLERCQLFDEIDCDKVKEILSIRNKLMHSSSNELSLENKDGYFDTLTSFLGCSYFRNFEEIRKMKEKMKSNKEKLQDFDSELDVFKDVRAAFAVQKMEIEADLERFKDWCLDMSGLEKLLKHVQDNESLATEVLHTNEKLIGTLRQAVEMGGVEGAKEASILGRMAGMAGAYMAGQYKRSSQHNN